MQNTYWDAQQNKEIAGKKAASSTQKPKSDKKSSKIIVADPSLPSDAEGKATGAARRPAPINPGPVAEDRKQKSTRARGTDQRQRRAGPPGPENYEVDI